MNASNLTQPSSIATLAPFIGYALTGLLISVCNMLIVASILCYEALRDEKEFILLMALALADAANMFNYFNAGVYRSWVYLSDRIDTLLTPAECLAKLPLFIWMFTNHLNSLMLVLISFDRVILVAWPLTYFALTFHYARNMVILAYGFVFGMGVLGIVLILTNEQSPTELAICLGSTSLFGPELSSLRRLYCCYFTSGPVTFALVSVVLFMSLYPIHKATKSKTTSIDVQTIRTLGRQRKLTTSLAICCSCTFFLYCVPFQLGHLFNYYDMPTVAQIFWILSNANPLANLIVYQLRIPEMRVALISMLQCKKLPPVITLWPKPKKFQGPQRKLGVMQGSPVPDVVPRRKRGVIHNSPEVPIAIQLAAFSFKNSPIHGGHVQVEIPNVPL